MVLTYLLFCDTSRTSQVVPGRVPLSGLGILLQGLLVWHWLVGPGPDLVPDQIQQVQARW